MFEYLCIILPLAVLAVAHLLRVRRRNAGTEIELKIAGQIAYAHRPMALFTSIAREH